MRWANNYSGEETARADFTVHMRDRHKGKLCIKMDDMEQTIFLVPKPRRFGGHQWYFVCPVMSRYCSVFWMPPGATRFCSRQALGRKGCLRLTVDPDNGAHRAKAKIKARLIGDCDPHECDLPPKPKWMRWSTYNR
jgi:hypothetical protein